MIVLLFCRCSSLEANALAKEKSLNFSKSKVAYWRKSARVLIKNQQPKQAQRRDSSTENVRLHELKSEELANFRGKFELQRNSTCSLRDQSKNVKPRNSHHSVGWNFERGVAYIFKLTGSLREQSKNVKTGNHSVNREVLDPSELSKVKLVNLLIV